LWSDEHRLGREEGRKDRPCAIVLITEERNGPRRVTVLPITHSPPVDDRLAVEIPVEVKRRLSLDDARSWVILSEANRFDWPGPDLRPAPGGGAESVALGHLPFGLFEAIRLKFLAVIRARRMMPVPRSE
jgi:hypothetical protein